MLGAKLGITSKQYNIVTDGLIGNYNPSFKVSYLGTGTTLNNLASSSWADGTTVNGGSVAALDFTPPSGNNAGYFDLDGTDDYVKAGQVYTFDNGDAFTLSCWVNQDAGTDGTRKMILSKSIEHGAYNGWYISSYSNEINMVLAGTSHTTTANRITTGNAYPLGEWLHLTITVPSDWTDADSIKIYFNGSNYPNMATDDNDYAGSALTSAEFNIGGRANGSYDFFGLVGETLIYNRVLSAGEVLQNYNASKDRYTN